MKRYWLERALIGGQWATSIEIGVTDDGIVGELKGGVPLSDDVESISGIVIPAIANVHSHAFQWKFAGQSEFRTRKHDSFWSWREQMYASLAGLDPERCEENAIELYRLMLNHGYSTVGEFHYVHNHVDGTLYQDPSSMAAAHIRAALRVGIRICMIPVLYQRGGFDDSPLTDAQHRFQLSDAQFMDLIGSLHSEWAGHPLVEMGMAFHSLRAVNPEKFGKLIQEFDAITGGGPIHIHVAEQIKEVDDCLLKTGKRPVELLFDHADIDQRWCLIHATHMSELEIEMVANSGAVVGLCPTTEANLGDGVFPAEAYLKQGGRISIGSDSHVSVCPFSELRLLEYGQRLTQHRRAVLCTDDESCGSYLIRKALEGGRQATQAHAPGKVAFDRGAAAFGLRVGGPADFVVLGQHPAIEGVPIEHLLSRLVFGQYGNPVERIMVAGKMLKTCPLEFKKTWTGV